MKYTLKYFGLIKDITKLDVEIIELDDLKLTLNDVKGTIENKYPDLRQTLYSFAINQRLVTDNMALQANDEIALLPPFAGG